MDLLFGQVRRRLLALLLVQAAEPVHLRGLARLARTSAGTAQRELRALEQVGLVRSVRQGSQVLFQANEASPTLPLLRALLEQTVCAADLIRSALAPLAARLTFAVIHGPGAAGTLEADSGIDIFVVGEVRAGEVCDALATVAPRIGRPLHPNVCASANFESRALATPHFVTAILGGPFIALIGEPLSCRATLASSPATARRTTA